MAAGVQYAGLQNCSLFVVVSGGRWAVRGGRLRGPAARDR